MDRPDIDITLGQLLSNLRNSGGRGVERPFPAYAGDEPFVFVCYAHDDSSIVYPEMAWLHGKGVNVWYDEGIGAGTVWRAEIAEAIERAERVLVYLSPRSIVSHHCNREISYALDRGIPILPIYLAEIELPPDLRLGLANRQAMHRHRVGLEAHLHSLMAALTAQPNLPRETTSSRPPSALAVSVLAVFSGLLAPALLGLTLARGIQQVAASWFGIRSHVRVLFGAFLLVYAMAIALLLSASGFGFWGLTSLTEHLASMLTGSATSELPSWLATVARPELWEGYIAGLLEGGVLGNLLGTLLGPTRWIFVVLLLGLGVPTVVYYYLLQQAGGANAVASYLDGDFIDLSADYFARKLLEACVLGLFGWGMCSLLDLPVPAVLGLLIGGSVLVPFVGALLIALPLSIIAYLSFGLTMQFYVALGAYATLQILDGSLLVPFLYRSIPLHPLQVLGAVFLFGLLWGLWGLLVAIPIAIILERVGYRPFRTARF